MTTALAPMSFTVDPWDPGYGMALAAEAAAELGTTSVVLDLDVEAPASAWAPIDPPRGAGPASVLLADGVRRIDARLWLHGRDAALPSAGIAASYAAGIVRCPLDGRALAALEAVRVSRSHFSVAEDAADLHTSATVYRAHRARGPNLDDLSLALQQRLTRLETDLVAEHRTNGELFLIDGPLRGRSHLPRTVGYIKTHQKSYLPAPQSAVVAALRSGQRTPVFEMGTSWRRYSWYVRLPVSSAAPWAGVARCEAGAELPIADVVALADEVAALLPSLAGVGYKDPRAPQNLVPIGGLERLLRHRLGDPRILYRALATAAR